MIRKLQSLATTLAILATSLVFVSVEAPTAAAATSATVDYAGVFDGATDSWQAGSNQELIPASTGLNFTVEAWVNPETINSADAGVFSVIAAQNQNGGGVYPGRFFLGLHEYSSSIWEIHVASVCNEGGWLSYGDREVSVPANAWTHLAVVHQPTQYTVYVNGSPVATIAMSGSCASAVGSDLAGGSIGASGGAPADFFNGQIDQVKIWGLNLSESQLRESMHSHLGSGVTGSPTLLSAYDFNQDSGTSLAPAAGNGPTFTAAGSPTFSDVKSETSDGQGRTVVTFPRSYLNSAGGWTPPRGMADLTALVVGGGGSGGNTYDNQGAGGGSSGQTEESAATVSGVTAVIVGQGGQKVAIPTGSYSSAGRAGQSSSFSSINSGGGAGGSGRNTTPSAGTSDLLTSSITALTYGQGGLAGNNTKNEDGAPGAPGSGNGGGGAFALSSSTANGFKNIGGNGGSGVVVLRYAFTPVVVNAISGAMNETLTLSGEVASLSSSATLVLSSKNGTLDISSTALTSSGATKVASYSGSGTSYLSLHGTSSELHAALNLVEITLTGPLTTSGSIKAEIYEDISLAANQYFNPSNGHIYQYVSTGSSFSAAEAAAESATISTNVGALSGYLATITSATERDWRRHGCDWCHAYCYRPKKKELELEIVTSSPGFQLDSESPGARNCNRARMLASIFGESLDRRV